MGAIYGLIRLDGPAVISHELQDLARPMASWGRDGGGVWCEGGVGLGQLVAHRTPESIHERGPRSVAGGAVVVVADGRLDNRDELCGLLGVPPAERSHTPDGQLIATAYERWGEEAVCRLFGDWAFAAYDRTQRRLVLARDHLGHTALHYHYDGKTLTFASRIRALLALPHVPLRLNEMRLAAHLVSGAGDVGTTFYEGISLLPPAHLLVFDEGTLRSREYWRPEQAPEVRLGSDDQYVERFLELFSSSVRARLRTTGGVATTLSAGLDSSAVTCLAATQLDRDGGTLTAFTSVPAHPEVAGALPHLLVDEWPLAHMVAGAHPVIDHVPVRGQDVTPLQAIARWLEIDDEPVRNMGNLWWLLGIAEGCQRRGVGVLLTGQLGNGGVSWPGEPGVAFRRLLKRDPRGALEAVAQRRRTPGTTWGVAVRRELLGPLRRRLEGEFERFRRLRPQNLLGPLIEPSFAQRLQLVARLREEGFDPTSVRSTEEERRVATLVSGAVAGGGAYQALGAAHDLDVRDPTADVRLLEFCLAIPPDQWLRGEHNRWLMRRALTGLVPPEVQWNRRRGVQSADLGYRLRSDREAVSVALERIEMSSACRSYLDLTRMRERWDIVRRDPTAETTLAAHQLVRGLGIGAFLVRFDGGGGFPRLDR